WWLHQALAALRADLARKDLTLVLKQGDARKIVPAHVRAIGAAKVFWNRRYGDAAAIDDAVAATLKRRKIDSASYAASLLHEPGTVLGANCKPYRVFS